MQIISFPFSELPEKMTRWRHELVSFTTSNSVKSSSENGTNNMKVGLHFFILIVVQSWLMCNITSQRAYVYFHNFMRVGSNSNQIR